MQLKKYKFKINKGSLLNDNLLVKETKKGNNSTFNFLVERYQDKILKLINKYIQDPVESLDLAQDVFIKAYKGISNFNNNSSFYTWLYKIAINTAKSYLAFKHKGTLVLSIEQLQDKNHRLSYHNYSYDDYGMKPYSGRMDGGYNKASNNELQKLYLSVINALPEKLKKIIELREICEKTYEEIAIITGCPIGTVRSRISRAKKVLQLKLKKYNI